MPLRNLLPKLVLMLGAAAVLGSNSAVSSAPTTGSVWQEGEGFVEAPGSGVKTVGEKGPASGGQALWGLALGKKGRSVRYELTLSQAVPNARLVFRYARTFWKEGVTAAVVPVELTGGGKTLQCEATFGETKGWGDNSSQWGLATAEVGDMAAGKWSVKLTSMVDDGDVCIDGFLVAPAALRLSPEEFAPMQRVRIAGDGYLGMGACTSILDQKSGRPLTVIVRCFAGEAGAVRVTLARPAEDAVELSPAAAARAEGDSGAQRLDFKYPALGDGAYTLKIACAKPAITLESPVWLAGELLAGLDERVAALDAFAKGLSKMDATAQRHQGDFDYALEYLKVQGQGHLRQCAASAEDANAMKYVSPTKMRAPEIVLANVSNTLAQYEETMVRLKDHKEPDAGRIGDLRRSFYSNAKSGPVRHRLFVPKSYATAEKMPLILALHGANDDEDGMMAGEDGAILELAERRGYILLTPTYSRGKDPNYMAHLLELMVQVRADYPKIDPSRIFAYGFSMGGAASSQIAAHHPEVFASVCSGGGLCPIESVDSLKVPIMVLIGSEDPGIKIIAPRVARMLELGVSLDLHVDPGVPHTCPARRYMTMAMDFFEKHPRK